LLKYVILQLDYVLSESVYPIRKPVYGEYKPYILNKPIKTSLSQDKPARK